MDKDKIKYLPIAFALGYIPLIARLHVYDSHFEEFNWFPAWEDGTMYDFFLYFKAAAVIITAAVMMLIILFDLKYFSKTMLIALAGYLLFVLISGILSEHRREAFLGSAESYESVPVILSYGIFFIYTYLKVHDPESIKIVLRMSFPGFVIIGVISLLQFLKADPFKNDIVKAITIPGRYSDLRDSLTFMFRPGEVYATLYNSNYVPQYFGFCLFIGMYFLIFENGLKARIAGLVTAVLSALAVIGSRSRTGCIAVMIAMIFFMFFLQHFYDGKPARILRTVAVVVVLASVGVVLFLGVSGKAGDIIKRAGLAREELKVHFIRDVRTDTDGVSVVTQNGTLIFSYDTDGEGCTIDPKDETGEEVAYELTDDMTGYILSDERFEGMTLTPVYVDERVCLCVEVDSRELVFLNTGDERGYLYYNKAGKFSSFKHYDRSTLFPDAMFSDRGLLWNNCLRLLPGSILKGSGAGTFVYVYPNDDDYYRLYDDTGYSFYDVKAHSLYLQQFIENGGIALLFFLIFYIVLSVNVIRRSGNPLVLAVLTGSVCYMICSLTVDSNVNTAPVFWTMAGMSAGTVDERWGRSR